MRARVRPATTTAQTDGTDGRRDVDDHDAGRDDEDDDDARDDARDDEDDDACGDACGDARGDDDDDARAREEGILVW